MAGSQLFNRVAIPLEDPAGKCFSEPSRPSASKAEPLQESFRNASQKSQTSQTDTIPGPQSNGRRDGKLLGNERRVSILSVQVAGAKTVCNGSYKYDGLHQGKPLFKADSGAIIYFHRFWKMNAVYKTSSWMYSLPDSRTALPPEGEWTREGSIELTSGPTPVVTLVDEPFKSLGEQGNSLRLEGGRSVLKREENKSWRWIELPVYDAPQKPAGVQAAEVRSSPEDPDAIPSLEELCAQLDAEDTVGSAGSLNFGVFGIVADEEEEPQPPRANGYFSSDMIRQMGQGMLTQIAQDARMSSHPSSNARSEGVDEPPWPLEQPRVGMAARLSRSDAQSQRGDAGNLLRANRLRFR